MRNISSSDHLPGEPEGAAQGFRPTGRQIGGGLIAVILIAFIAANSKTVSVSLVFLSADLPLWLVLAITAVLGFGVGILFGSRRAKAKLRDR